VPLICLKVENQEKNMTATMNIIKPKVVNQDRKTTATPNKKSGKGLSHGVISELSAFFAVKPGQTVCASSQE
jgi:hypothetical protein